MNSILQPILLAGASSGVGKTTTELFAQLGWNVANMQHSQTDLMQYPSVWLNALDVTQPGNAETAIGRAVRNFSLNGKR